MAENNRLDPRTRYTRDGHFRMLVDALYHQMVGCEYTATELREALFLATERYETHYPANKLVFDRDGNLVEARREYATRAPTRQEIWAEAFSRRKPDPEG